MSEISNLERSQMRQSRGREDVAGGSNATLFLSLEVRDDVRRTRLVVLRVARRTGDIGQA